MPESARLVTAGELEKYPDDGYRTIESCVVGLVDFAHAAGRVYASISYEPNL
jgi:hypothetical protein